MYWHILSACRFARVLQRKYEAIRALTAFDAAKREAENDLLWAKHREEQLKLEEEVGSVAVAVAASSLL